MGQPAARVGDLHVCPMATPGVPPIPHVGGPILPPGCPTVLIGYFPAARMTDKALCVGPPDVIVKGAMPVLIGNFPAARVTDQTAHGGSIVLGCFTVLIGLAGTVGDIAAGIAACQALANGRTSGSTSQTYNNCGIESSRGLINQANGSNVSENTLFNQSINAGRASGPATVAGGGTFPSQRQAILAANGVPSSVVTPTPTNMGLAVAQGRGVIAAVYAGDIWTGANAVASPPAPGTGGHAVTVIGVEYDANGNPVNVIINDTGTGNCGVSIPANTFNNSMAQRASDQGSAAGLNVTNNPIW